MQRQEIIEQYKEHLTGISWDEAVERLETEMSGKPFTTELREWLCNDMMFSATIGYTHYKKTDIKKNQLIQRYIENVAKLPKSKHYDWAVYYFFTRQHKKCI